MPRTLVTPPHRVPWRVRAKHLLAAGLAAAIAVGAAAISYSGHPGAPAEPNAAQAEAITFGDAPVVKGARGGKTHVVTLPVFGDPAVRKGAGGR